jgi:O-antigen/teichoic acid export membrane protein
MLKKLFTHSFIYSVAPQLPRLASLAILPLTTAYLTDADYGIYGIITAYLFFIIALKDLGLGVVFVNTFYKHPHRWPIVWRMLHGHLLIWGLVFAIIQLVILYIAIPSAATSQYLLIAFLTLVPSVIFDNTSTLGNYYYRFSEKPMFIALATIVSGLVTVVATYYCIVVLKLGYMGWFWASFVSSATVFLLYLYPVYFKLKLFPILRLRPRFMKPHLKVSLPMIPHNYSSYLLNSSDRVVMDLYKVNIGQVGLYNMGYQFGNYFEAFGEAIGLAVCPFYSKLYSANTDKAHKDALRLTILLMTFFLAATFFVSLWLKEIFLLMISNEQLESAYHVGIIIIMGYAYRPMYWSAGVKLSIAEKTGILWRITFIGGVVNVILNMIFVPYYGIYAAAVSTLVSLMYVGFAGYYFKTYKKLKGLNNYPLQWMLAIMATTGIVYLLRDINWMYKAGITVAVMALLGTMFMRYRSVLKEVNI